MKEVDIVSKIVNREGGTFVPSSKGTQSIDLSDYLLKSIWDKVFEVRTDSQGIEYIFGKLPMVTQYGITMYSGYGVDIPSLASGLPFDGRTIWYNPDTRQIEVIGGTGGGSGEGVSNFWDLSGIPSWITNSKPKYTYSEIEGTPDLSGYATQTWVKNQGYLTQHQDLSGYQPLITSSSKLAYSLISGTPTSLKNPNALSFGSKSYDGSAKITLTAGDLGALTSHQTIYTLTFASGTFASGTFTANSANKTINIPTTTSHISEGSNLYFTNARAVSALTETLKAYVTLGGTQTITGEKNFTGGLKVNGSPIYYDSTKKYWKLEGDLLVTGGVTMYGSDSSFTPSTIMDAINVDGTTISKEGGVLKVIGGTGGGVADSVAWANITGKPTFATVATSGKYSDLSGTPSSLPASDVYSWAKSATKPTYTWSEITSKPTWIGSSKPTYSYSEITGAISTTELQNYLTSNSYLNVTSGDDRYLKLSGGEISGTGLMPLTINTSSSGIEILLKCKSNAKVHVGWSMSDGVFLQEGESTAYIGVQTNKIPYYFNGTRYTLWHEGNFKPSDYLPLIGGTLSGSLNTKDFYTGTDNFGTYIEATSNSSVRLQYNKGGNKYDQLSLTNGTLTFNSNTIWHSGNDGSGSGLDADLLDGEHESTFAKWKSGIASSGEHRHIGYAYGSGGWKTSGAAMSFGASENYFMQIQGGGSKNKDIFLYARYIYEGVYSDWKTIAFTDSNVASATTVMMNYSYNQDVNYPLVFTSRDNIGVAQNATLYIDFSGRPTYNPKTDTLTVGNLSGNATYATNSSKLYSTDLTYSYGSANPYYGYLTYNQTYGEWDFKVSPNTPEYIHVYSSDKLRTARTIWGQSFDGTGNVSGNILLGVGSDYAIGTGYSSSDKRTFNNITIGNSTSGIVYNGGTWTGSTSFNAHTFTTGAYSNALVINNGGNVGIGTTNPYTKLHVEGDFKTNDVWIGSDTGTYIEGTQTGGLRIQYANSDKKYTQIHLKDLTVTINNNLLCSGGITMYSDQRKKTILNHVELSLKDIADAPLIEHYYNSDDKKTTHVGSIAQYWASMNDWFCKLDSEGYYTMEIQNAALASAISIARELERYETKTDKAIKKLKKRICELEEKIERLKAS